MTRSIQTWILIRREFLERARSRAFQLTMLITVGLIGLAVVVISFASGGSDTTTIGLTGDLPAGTEQALALRAIELDVDLELEAFPDRAAAEAALVDGDIRALYTGTEIVWFENDSNVVRAVITGAAATTAFRETASDLGLSESELAGAITPPHIKEVTLNPPDADQEPRQIAAFVGLFLLYMAILVFGQFVALGVMEEKQNRVIEVVLARVEPTQVLASKVVGIGALGLVQLIVLGGAIWVALTVVDAGDISLPAIGLEVLVSVLFWFILGYSMYAVIYAGLGATVSRQEDLQGVMMLPLTVILPGFFLAQAAANNPDSMLAIVSSHVPLWTPMVMPIRSALGSVTIWEQALSVVVVVLFAYLTMRLSARLYRGAVLRLGAKVRLRDAWRAVD